MKSRRHAPLPPGWYRTRKRILKRDGYRCTHIREDSTGGRCPEKATDVDHIIPGDDHSDSNLRSLCGYHHRIKSSSEGGRRVHQQKTTKKHPGMCRVMHVVRRSFLYARGRVRASVSVQFCCRASMYANAC